MRKLLSTAALAVACSVTGTARAEIITYQFTATVLGGAVFYPDESYDPDAALMGDFHIVGGNTISGRLSYDTAMPKWFVRQGVQWYLGGYGAMSLRVAENGFTFASSSADRPQASVGNDDVRKWGVMDHFRFNSHSYSEDNVPPYVASLLFVDRDAAAFDSTALPTVLDLGSFEQATLNVMYQSAAFNSQFDAQLTSLQRVSAVPEPTSAAMILAGLGLLGGSRLLRRRR